MGCDCAPQVAALFLYWYEHDYIALKVENKNPVFHTLKHASRYIDDLKLSISIQHGPCLHVKAIKHQILNSDMD